jgi:hypothetical protein
MQGLYVPWRLRFVAQIPDGVEKYALAIFQSGAQARSRGTLRAPIVVTAKTGIPKSCFGATQVQGNPRCAQERRDRVGRKSIGFWQNEPKIPNVFNGNLLAYRVRKEETMLFDLYLQLQSARLHEQGSTKQTKLIRGALRRLGESPVASETTTAGKPATREVSRDLALAMLLSMSDDHGRF